MEKLSSRGSFNSRISCGMMSGLATILVVTLFTSGCHKAKPPVAQTVVDQNTNQAAADKAPVYQQSSAVVPAPATTDASGAPDLKELNRSMLRWILGNRRRPQNFEDFAATAGVTIPPPPAGKKYVLGKDMHIQLVDR